MQTRNSIGLRAGNINLLRKDVEMFYSQARMPAFTSQTTTFTALSHVQVKREESYSFGKKIFRQTVSLLITNFKVVTEYIIIMFITGRVYFSFPCH